MIFVLFFPMAFSSLERISVFIAQRTGLSRRHVEELIKKGCIYHNGYPVEVFALPPEEFAGSWYIEERGRRQYIPREKAQEVKLWAYHKSRGELVTWEDPESRPTVFQRVRSQISGPLWSVGRLDYGSTGLLLITNTPTVAHILEKSDVERRYEVILKGCSRYNAQEWLRDFDDGPRGKYYDSSFSLEALWVAVIHRLQQGITLDGVDYAPCKTRIIDFCPQREGMILEITLREGKNREIRRIMTSMGLYVTKLHRLSYGPFFLKSLPLGEVKPLSVPESLLDCLH